MNVFGLGPLELVVVLVVALIIFGPARLPEMGRALGRGIREFQQALRELSSEMEAPAMDKGSGVSQVSGDEQNPGPNKAG